MAEAEPQVIDDIKLTGKPGIEPHDVAILCRTNEQPRRLKSALQHEKLVHMIGGQSFYDRRTFWRILHLVLDSPSETNPRCCDYQHTSAWHRLDHRGRTPCSTHR